MGFSYLKKLILLPIPILLVFGFLCQISFAQNISLSDHGSHIQNQEVTHHINCHPSNPECSKHYNQTMIATVQNARSTDQITKKTPDTNPVFLVADYSHEIKDELGKRLIFYKGSSLNTSLYQNWPVGLARSHLS